MRWFSVVNMQPNGEQFVIFDGKTTKDFAVGRARMYADATTGPLRVLVFRGSRVGRLVFTLIREA